ncbi:Hypothetical predicted protein [Olea europaea subsp. europaea]|uniref:Uncharacterized protein n=1 Tax=Olea europaea subsp. europaea TaxID=158383 RepID=A0A8S0RA07_OLEEU|nr:Hypothetical predicted protein [Olea europaea subsp. europaea]
MEAKNSISNDTHDTPIIQVDYASHCAPIDVFISSNKAENQNLQPKNLNFAFDWRDGPPSSIMMSALKNGVEFVDFAVEVAWAAYFGAIFQPISLDFRPVVGWVVKRKVRVSKWYVGLPAKLTERWLKMACKWRWRGVRCGKQGVIHCAWFNTAAKRLNAPASIFCLVE